MMFFKVLGIYKIKFSANLLMLEILLLAVSIRFPTELPLMVISPL